MGIMWLVTVGNAHFICNAFHRETAKQLAAHWFAGDPDKYIVTPLTKEGDRVHVAVTVSA